MSAFDDQLREAERTLTQLDPMLGRVITKVGPCGLTKSARFEPFSALLNSIAHQQLHGKAAETIVRRVKEKFAEGGWPTPQTMATANLRSLRSCGLSRAKSLAIRDLAQKTLDGTVPTSRQLHRMHEADIIERVTQVRGIGQWTVEMMLMFRLGRLDVLPVDDFGVRKGFSVLLGSADTLLPKKQLTEYGARWQPYRSVASWYLWRVADGV